MSSYNVRFWKIEVRKNRRTPYRVRWTVAGEPFGEPFLTSGLAESFRSQLITAARAGEGFDLETGLPDSMVRKLRDVSFYTHALEFADFAWKGYSAKSRVSMVETLTRVVPVVVRDLPGTPAPALLRAAMGKKFNQGGHAGTLTMDESKAIAWLEKASRPISALENAATVCDVLDVLAVNLDGRPAAAEYFSRRRRMLHRMLGYAVRKERLDKNPLSKNNLPEGWTPPAAPDDAVDPRSVGAPALIAGMLTACSYVGRRQGPRFVAFYACMYYAMMRPSEVAALTRNGCHLPEEGWGYLTFADASPAAGKAFTDDGQVHELRGLKGRTKGRPNNDPRARKPTRKVPIPPELVLLIRLHIEQFGAGSEGRIFRSANGNPIQPSTWWQVWQKVRQLSLPPEQLGTPLLRRPYDLRHSGVTWRLNSGVPPTEVAAWAGHSVDVLMRVYAKCMTGLQDVWISRMDNALHLEDDPGEDGR